MNKLLECTRGPWETLADASHPANVRVRATLRLHIAKVYASDTGRDPVCQANAALIAAAFDHALIWWATEHSDDFDIIKEKPGDEYILLGGAGQNQATIDPSGHLFGPSLAIDPFGFPILTDDLRARLIAKMEAAK